MPKNWRFALHDQGRVRQVSTDLRVSPLVAEVLVARGYETADAAREFLSGSLMDLHDPNLLPGVSEAAERVVGAIQAKRRITIYGDYDVDGVTGTSLLWHCLRLAGAEIDYYIPHRLEEGYGLNCQALQQLHEEDPDRLLITVDCGIASVREAELARELGLELIITDHHHMAEELPDAVRVHPRLPGSEYPFGDLCGAGVAFKLAWGVCQLLGDGKKASPRMREFLIGAVGLAAIGTVADVVPLTGENRILVRYGLESLIKRPTPGLTALMKVAGCSDNGTLDAEDIGFGLGPRINAAGRLGQARLAVELLTTDNAERAKALASYVDELNKQRQSVERKIFKQAKELVKENPEWEEQAALVLSHPDWHAGVIGIVASRVVERFEKPTILIAMNDEGLGQGSGRSFAGYDLHAGLSAGAEFLAGFGGHSAAAGLKIEADRIDDFREAFCSHVAENLDVTDKDLEIKVDAEVTFADLTHRAVTEISRLGPFGQANRRPVFATTNVELAEPPRKMGGGERHLSLRLRHYNKVLRAVAFGQADWADEIEEAGEVISVCFSVNINRYNGYENVELRLIDWQPAKTAAPEKSVA